MDFDITHYQEIRVRRSKVVVLCAEVTIDSFSIKKNFNDKIIYDENIFIVNIYISDVIKFTS